MVHHTPITEPQFLRIKQIIGDPKATPPIPPVIPVSRATLWDWVKQGKFPPPVKFGTRFTCWKVEDVRAFIEQLNGKGGAA